MEIIDSYRFDCSSILNEETEIEKAEVVRYGKKLLLKCTKEPGISRVRHVSHTVSVAFNSADMICTSRIQTLIVNAASEVTNHHTTPHPCFSAARLCRKQKTKRCFTTLPASNVHDYLAVIRLHSILISSLGLSSYSSQQGDGGIQNGESGWHRSH